MDVGNCVLVSFSMGIADVLPSTPAGFFLRRILLVKTGYMFTKCSPRLLEM